MSKDNPKLTAEGALDTLYSLANTFQMMPDYNPMLEGISGFIESQGSQLKQQQQEMERLRSTVKEHSDFIDFLGYCSFSQTIRKDCDCPDCGATLVDFKG